MKLLRLQVEGLSLIKETLDITFYGTQNVKEDDITNMYHLFGNIYLNCTNAFIGINASGKTTILQTIVLALNILNNQPINHIPSKYILSNSETVIMTMFYFLDNKIYCLKTEIKSQTKSNEQYYFISDEQILYKSVDKKFTKKTLTDINSFKLLQKRNLNEDFLSDDVSMIIGQNKKTGAHLLISSIMSFTDVAKLKLNDSVTNDIIQFFDPTVEYLYTENINNSYLIHLKFKDGKDISLKSISDLQLYLSSGTIKGIMTFSLAKQVLKEGGYMLIDEIENHFNKEIVSTLIRLFMDSEFNVNGSILIYTTHYPELLDEYDRNDCIYITENINGLKATNLSNILKRKDIKKSDAYQANIIANTAPKYQDYICMKRSMKAFILNK